MKLLLICLFFAIPQLALAGPRMPVGKELFQAEEFVKSHKLPGGELRTFHTKKTFQQLREELQAQLGETWVEVKPPQVKLPKELEERRDLLQNTVILENTENPKLRVSITLTKVSEGAEEKSLLLLTLMKNYQPPEVKKHS